MEFIRNEASRETKGLIVIWAGYRELPFGISWAKLLEILLIVQSKTN